MVLFLDNVAAGSHLVLSLKQVKSATRRWHREAVFQACIREVRSFLDTGGSLPHGLADRLSYGWGNEGWAAKPLLLEFILRELSQFRGTALECGSGLSTVILGLIASTNNGRVVTLEHDQGWHAILAERLTSVGLGTNGLLYTPLVRNQDFDWYYDHPYLATLPPIDFVLCDGPPNQTRGGRYGLLPRLFPRLADGALIIVDDSHRTEEIFMINKWISEYPGKLSVESTYPTFQTLRVLGPTAPHV